MLLKRFCSPRDNPSAKTPVALETDGLLHDDNEDDYDGTDRQKPPVLCTACLADRSRASTHCKVKYCTLFFCSFRRSNEYFS